MINIDRFDRDGCIIKSIQIEDKMQITCEPMFNSTFSGWSYICQDDKFLTTVPYEGKLEIY